MQGLEAMGGGALEEEREGEVLVGQEEESVREEVGCWALTLS